MKACPNCGSRNFGYDGSRKTTIFLCGSTPDWQSEMCEYACSLLGERDSAREIAQDAVDHIRKLQRESMRLATWWHGAGYQDEDWLTDSE